MPSKSRGKVDADIYGNLDYYSNPKEYFSLVLDRIEAHCTQPASLVDIGSANGAFLFQAKKRFSHCEMTGLEPVKSLVSIAQKYCDANFLNGDLVDTKIEQKFNVVTMLGVLGVFSDLNIVFAKLLDLMEKGGALVVFSPFNEEPIDVVLDYRVAPNGAWQTGHNLFSMSSIEDVVSRLGFQCDWTDFQISHPIPKTKDPMRSWTESFRDNPHHLVYGTNMFSTMKILTVY